MIVSLIFVQITEISKSIYIILLFTCVHLYTRRHIDIQRLHDIQSVNIVVNL